MTKKPGGKIPISFRAQLAGYALIMLILAFWFSTNKSSNPAILGRYSFPYFVFLLGCFGTCLLLCLLQFRQPLSLLYAFRWRIGLLVFTLLLCLAALEIAVRILDPLGISYFEASTRYQLDLEADDYLVYKQRPYLNTSYSGIRFSTNELGLRERPILPKTSDEYRILFLGDSVTLGWGVQVEATFCRKLEAVLSEKFSRKVRTINAGVGGYNTMLEWRFLERKGSSLDSDLIVLFYVSDDAAIIEPPFNPSGELSLSGKSPPQIIEILMGKMWMSRLFYAANIRRNVDYLPDPKFRGWLESMEALEKIAIYCRDRGVSFCTVVWRHPQENAYEDRLWKDIQAVSHSIGFPIADVRPWWQGYDWRDITISVVDIHPNEKGHDILTRRILEFINDSGIFRSRQETFRKR